MKDWQSQTHVKWDCKCHIVIVPKYRQRVLFGKRRKQIGEILRDLCRQKGIGLQKGNAQPDHVLHHAEIIQITGNSYRLRNQAAQNQEPNQASRKAKSAK